MNPDTKPRDDACLARPSSISLLWWVFGAVVSLWVGAQWRFTVYGYFGEDGWLAFGSI